jgi:hypothetical protein
MTHLLFSKQGWFVHDRLFNVIISQRMSASVFCVVLELQWALLGLKSVKKLPIWY